MFNIGSPFFVLNNSAKQGSTTPKRGSLGYTTNKGHIFFLYFEEEDVEVAVDSTNFLFTRYGFEEGRRGEYKAFLNIVPIFPEWKDDTENKIIKFVDNLGALPLDKWAQLREYMMVPKNTTIGIAVPIIGQPLSLHKLAKSDDKDFVAWMDAFLRSNTVRSLLNEIQIHDGSYLQMTSGAYLNVLRDMVNSREQRTSYLQTFKSDSSHRENAVRAIRQIVLTASAIDNRKSIDLIRNLFENDGVNLSDFESKAHFIQSMMYDFYTPTFDQKVKVVEQYGDKRTWLCVDSMLRTRKLLSSLVTEEPGIITGLSGKAVA